MASGKETRCKKILRPDITNPARPDIDELIQKSKQFKKAANIDKINGRSKTTA
jgi:hypothetical protein